MSLRISSAALLLALAGCDAAEGQPAAGTMVDCALAGAADFAPECTMERQERDDIRLLVVRHPDGGFRRFELGVPGRGIATADGMEVAEVSQLDGMVEVQVGPDRYRLPVAERAP